MPFRSNGGTANLARGGDTALGDALRTSQTPPEHTLSRCVPPRATSALHLGGQGYRGQDGPIRRACSESTDRIWRVHAPSSDAYASSRRCRSKLRARPDMRPGDVPVGEGWWGAVRTPVAAAAPPGAGTPPAVAAPTVQRRLAPYSLYARALSALKPEPSIDSLSRPNGASRLLRHHAPVAPNPAVCAPSSALPRGRGRVSHPRWARPWRVGGLQPPTGPVHVPSGSVVSCASGRCAST